MERIGPKHIRTLLLHIVLWSICIQRSRQTEPLSNVDSAMPDRESSYSGTSSSETVCLLNRASNNFLRIRGRRDVDSSGAIDNVYQEDRVIITTFNDVGGVTIKGESSNFYLCVTRKGEIVGRRNVSPKKNKNIICRFLMDLRDNGAFEFEPLQMITMKIGFRRDGGKRNARTVKPYTKYSQFYKDDCIPNGQSHDSQSGTRSEHDSNSVHLQSNRIRS